MSLSASGTDLLLNKDRRSRSWQGWSKEGRKKLLGRFQKQQNEQEESDDSGETDQAQLHDGHVDDEEEEEELDVIVSSWKQNYTYFQQEQAKRAVVGARKDGDIEDDDEEEDSLLQAIAEEDYDYADDESSIFDDATMYTLATYEEADFRDFVRRHQEKQQPKSFTERFLEALGMRDDDDETVVSVSTRVTATHTPTLAILPEEEEEPPSTPPRDNNSNAIIIDNDFVSREGKEQREAAVLELPQDAPPIPMDDGQEVFLQEEIQLQPSHVARKDKRRKNRGDDVSLSPSVLSRTMTM